MFSRDKFAKMYHNTQVQIVTILGIMLFKSLCQYLFKVYGKGLTSHDTLDFFFVYLFFFAMQISQWWTKQLMTHVFLCSAVAITLMW